MTKLRIQPHERLNDWVAAEKGYFKDLGLEIAIMGAGAQHAERFRISS